MKGDIQDVKHAIALVLAGSEFAQILQLVDTEKAVTIATPTPTQVFEGEKNVTTDQGYPVVEIIGARTVFDNNSAHVKDTTHEISIVWTHVGDDELLIAAQIERLVRAVRDLFWPKDTQGYTLQGVNACPTEFVSEEYSQLMPGRVDGTFVKGSATTIKVRTLSE